MGKTTEYRYSANTNLLLWVKYPDDTDGTRTDYTYDSMHRLATASTNVVSPSQTTTLTATYGYTDDVLTSITTASSAYAFSYGYFGNRSSVKVGSRTLASYKYTSDENKYLSELDYGNGDKVKYSYDEYGRLVSELYEDGETVTYRFDNSGELAAVIDSATGTTTKYYWPVA